MTGNQTITIKLRTSDNKFYSPTLAAGTTLEQLTAQLVEDKIIPPGDAPLMLTNEANDQFTSDPGTKLSELGIAEDTLCSICVMPMLG